MRVPTDGTFYPTEGQATLALSALQEECTSALGGGGSFSGSIYKEPVEYNQTTDTYSYLYYLQVSCNTCSSANQTQALEDYKSTCREQCLSITPLCQAEVWGSTILNTDCDLGLPITTGECAESSSSIESSSSEESSSSVASSSSVYAGSSSSGSLDSVDYSTCSCSYNSTVEAYLFDHLPSVHNGNYGSVTGKCKDGLFLIITKIPVVFQISAAACRCGGVYHVLDGYSCRTGSEAYSDESCGNVSNGVYFYCDTTTCYYDFRYSSSFYADSPNVTNILFPSDFQSSAQVFSFINSHFDNWKSRAAVCRSLYSSSSVTSSSSSFYPSVDSLLLSSSTVSDSVSSAGSSSEESYKSSSSSGATPGSSAASEESSSSSTEINSSTSGTGPYESSSSGSEETGSSSSGNDEISSSSASGSAEIGSSTSGPESGESSGSVSSSSEGPYESSSSGNNETDSSSSGNNESSSSSASGIDSSCPDCETNVRSAEAVYTSDQIFNSGLENMEDGKCYSLNPDRGTQYGWINNNAQDSWWWVEVPCDGSAPEEESTSAGCVENQRGSNAVYTSADCFSSGLDNMEEGECYSLNPDRGTQYGWINNNAQDSWWWVETPCEDNETDETCPDGAILNKRSNTGTTTDASPQNSMEKQSRQVRIYYDVLGRMVRHSTTFNTKKPLFIKQQKIKQNDPVLSDYTANFLMKTIDGFVKAEHTVEIQITAIDKSISDPQINIISFDYELITTILKIVDQDEPLLIRHEQKHKEIYDIHGNWSWKDWLSENQCHSKKFICKKIKLQIWPDIQNQMHTMIQYQNDWDEEDKNNVSDARLNEKKIMATLKQKLNKETECEFP